MAKVILRPIGAPIEEAMPAADYRANRVRMGELNELLAARTAEVKAGWGQAYVERAHAKGKLTTWERIEALTDPGSRFFPIQTFVNYGRTFGDDSRTSPAAGVICGLAAPPRPRGAGLSPNKTTPP